MDPLRRDDLESALATAPSERARQALQAMRTGIRLERAALRARFPDASSAEVDAWLQRWLERDA